MLHRMADALRLLKECVKECARRAVVQWLARVDRAKRSAAPRASGAPLMDRVQPPQRWPRILVPP
jgi:hypothetical protein